MWRALRQSSLLSQKVCSSYDPPSQWSDNTEEILTDHEGYQYLYLACRSEAPNDAPSPA